MPDSIMEPCYSCNARYPVLCGEWLVVRLLVPIADRSGILFLRYGSWEILPGNDPLPGQPVCSIHGCDLFFAVLEWFREQQNPSRQRDPVPAVQATLLPDPARAEREMDRRLEARQGVAAELVALALAHLRHPRSLQRQSLRGFGRSLGGGGGIGTKTALIRATGGSL